MLGTAAYLAPEQARGREAGPQADLYALGVVTYQLLSGRLPYEATSLTELALKQQREVPPRLDEVNREVAPQLALAVDRALALDPRQRYAGAAEMRAALLDGARGVGAETSATRIAGPATAATGIVGSTEATSVAGAPCRRAGRARRASPSPLRRPARAARRQLDPAPAARSRRATPPARERRRGRTRRLLGTLLVLILLAGGGAAAVVATSQSDDTVRLRRVVYDDVQRASDRAQAARRRQHALGASAVQPRAGGVAGDRVERNSPLDDAATCSTGCAGRLGARPIGEVGGRWPRRASERGRAEPSGELGASVRRCADLRRRAGPRRRRRRRPPEDRG